MSQPTRGLVFRGPRQPLALEDLLLDGPGPGEVLVRMSASGVCHSDLHVVDGEWERPRDVVMGHEGAGVVEALGSGVAERPAKASLSASGLRAGDLVVLAWTAPCGSCPSCQRGEAWLCATPRGSGHRLDPALVRVRRADGTPVGVYSGIGTFGERQVVAAEAAVAIDPATPPEVAALIGCAVTTGVGAVLNTAGVRRGESVAVLGLGGVGMAAVMAAAYAGASPVVAIDTVPEKLALASQAGATHRVLATGRPAWVRHAIRDIVPGGVDHAFEAIGRVDTVELAVELVRPGGAATLVGMTPQDARAGIDVYRLVEGGMTVRGSNYGSAIPARDFPRIAALYREGHLPLDLLVSQLIGLDEVAGALAAMRRGEGIRRVVVHTG